MYRSQGVPEIIIVTAPLMEELLRLREENTKLRFEKHPELPGIKELIKGTKLTIYQGQNGKWNASFPYHGGHSGIGEAETMIDAFKMAVNHMCGLLNENPYEEEE